VTLFLALGLWFLWSIRSAPAAQNLVYIDGNITATGQNAVIALLNDGAGNMTPLTGSPFATGGTGVGHVDVDTPLDSDGELALNAAGTLLFAVNGHSNNFSAFNLNADGSLTLISGSPFPSGGTQPASIGYKDNFLGNGVSMMVIANKDSDPFQTQTAPNYTTFQVSATGIPHLNAGSTLTLPVGSSPWQFLMPRNSKNFFGILFTGDTVSSYRLLRNGNITNLSSLTTVGANGGGVLHPRVPDIYVTLPGLNMLNVLSYDAAYNLSLVQTLPEPGSAPCWAATNRAGTRLYITETVSSSLTVYDITSAENPVQLQHFFVSGQGAKPTHIRLDPTEEFLYVLDRKRVLHVLDVAADGTVSENRAPFSLGLPAGTVPLGLAVLRK
jgi:Lactonase, 7-bladed beta-propeller